MVCPCKAPPEGVPVLMLTPPHLRSCSAVCVQTAGACSTAAPVPREAGESRCVPSSR